MLCPGLLSHRLSPAVKTQISIRTLATASRAPSENHGRWLSDTKRRLGKLFLHGTTAEETREASDILKDLTKNWRDYVAASEGFLTGETRRGLYRHNVVWGDMVLRIFWKPFEGSSRLMFILYESGLNGNTIARLEYNKHTDG
jgi:hypothetical protein